MHILCVVFLWIRSYTTTKWIYPVQYESIGSLSIKYIVSSVTRRKLPNVCKNCPKMISLEQWLILTPLQNLPRNVGDLGILIYAKGFKKLPKVQKIAKSGHTDRIITWKTSNVCLNTFCQLGSTSQLLTTLSMLSPMLETYINVHTWKTKGMQLWRCHYNHPLLGYTLMHTLVATTVGLNR